MDVILRVLWNIEVDDKIYVFHINSSGRYVGGNQKPGPCGFEAGEHLGALGLLHIPVKGLGFKMMSIQIFGQLVHSFFGVAEDNGESGVMEAEKQVEGVHLPQGRDRIGHLVNCLDRGLLFIYLHHGGVVLKLMGQAEDFRRHGGGKQDRLPLCGGFRQNGLYVFLKTHAQHFVGLVQYHQMYAVQLQRSPAHMVHDPPRCADYHIGAGLQGVYLPLHRYAAVYLLRADAGAVAGELAQLSAGLHGQLAGGAENEDLYLPAGGVDRFHSGDAKGKGFPRPGLGTPNHILALPNQGNTLGLDFRRFRKTQVLHCPQQRFCQV